MEKSAKIHHGRRAESRYIPGAAGIKAGGILSSQLEPNKNYGLHSSISKILQTENLRFTINLWQTNKENYVFLWMLGFSEHF